MGERSEAPRADSMGLNLLNGMDITSFLAGVVSSQDKECPSFKRPDKPRTKISRSHSRFLDIYVTGRQLTDHITVLLPFIFNYNQDVGIG